MKKNLLFCFSVLVLSASSVVAQTNCNAGFESPVFPNTMNVPPNTLFAIRVTAANAGTLTDISVYNSGLSSANIKLAVYDDNGGVPGNLVASTGPVALTMTAGVITTSVTPVAVAAGDYYLAGVLDVSASALPLDNTTQVTLYGTAMPYANPFPANGSAFSTVPGNPVNIWMNITCSTTGVSEVAGNPSFSMNSYPSPVNENCILEFNSGFSLEASADVYDCNGQLVIGQALYIAAGESTTTITMSDLAPGIYFMVLHDAIGNVVAARKVIKA